MTLEEYCPYLENAKRICKDRNGEVSCNYACEIGELVLFGGGKKYCTGKQKLLITKCEWLLQDPGTVSEK